MPTTVVSIQSVEIPTRNDAEGSSVKHRRALAATSLPYEYGGTVYRDTVGALLAAYPLPC